MPKFLLQLNGVEDLDLYADLDQCVPTGVIIGHPNVRAVEEDAPGRDGVKDSTAFMGARVISIQLTIKNRAGDGHRFARHLKRFCVPGVRPTLTFQITDMDQELTTVLRADQFSMPWNLPSFTNVSVSWKCPDPNLYIAGDPSSVIVPFSGAGEGRTYPRTYQ